jgi:hypothetical protein
MAESERARGEIAEAVRLAAEPNNPPAIAEMSAFTMTASAAIRSPLASRTPLARPQSTLTSLTCCP